ncbi:MAG TPA: hypothetical protein VNS09_07430 [Solirubrobacter sp.]|nr:hypothetical protein [Solirubrobacter sp.]
MHRTSLLRGLAGVAGAALLLFTAWGVLFVFLVGAIAAQAPDPFVENGDPCCGHPDTWSEVVVGVGWTLGYALADALLVCVGVALVVWATRGRWPRVTRLAYVPVAGVGAVAAILAVVLIPQLGEGRTPPDCDTFAFSRSGWRSTDEDAQKSNAYGIAHCRLVEGRTMAEVRDLLGRPSTSGQTGERTYWSYLWLYVFFEHGRAVDAHAGAS